MHAAFDNMQAAFKGDEFLLDRVNELMDTYAQTFASFAEMPNLLPADLFKPEEPVDFEAKPEVDTDEIQNQIDMRTYRAKVTPNLSTDGFKPHAKGLWTVPYDNYPILAHRGEQLLTASQARQNGGDVDYGYVAEMIGSEIRSAFDRLGVYLYGDKVGDMTSRRVDKNIRAKNYAVQRAMGG